MSHSHNHAEKSSGCCDDGDCGGCDSHNHAEKTASGCGDGGCGGGDCCGGGEAAHDHSHAAPAPAMENGKPTVQIQYCSG